MVQEFQSLRVSGIWDKSCQRSAISFQLCFGAKDLQDLRYFASSAGSAGSASRIHELEIIASFWL